MRICFVIQRYGVEATGGAETHCRWLARLLSRRHEVEVVTTCALDYAEWTDHYPAGTQLVEGTQVTRFPVARPRDRRAFAFQSDVVFGDRHTVDDERAWVVQNGPFCPALVEALPRMRHVDLFVFYSYRYYTTFFGLPQVASRAVLVPTAEEDQAASLSVFRELFRLPRGILYLTPEERDLVQRVSDNGQVPDAVIGSGIDTAPDWESVRLRERFDLPERYVLYVGRIDRSKGVDRLADYYRQLAAEWPDLPPLLLAGRALIDVAPHPKLHLLGEVSEPEKFALLDGCELLVMPSEYESLSIAVLEAWAMGKPVLANGECAVLRGQCLRSNGGLPYRKYAEFAPALRLLLARQDLRDALGRSGREYVRREYAWDVVEERTNALLDRIPLNSRESRPAPPIPSP